MLFSMVFRITQFFHAPIFRKRSTLQFEGIFRVSRFACFMMNSATWLFGGIFEGVGFEPTRLKACKSSE
jgi:hypothetical protein